MKINGTLSLVAIGIALASTTTWAQTTPTGTVSSAGIPQGAVAPDSTPSKTATRNQKRAMRQSRRSMNQNNPNSTGNTTTQDAQYRQSSSSDGTAINNSNTTNYNSNNVTNAPTGAGSNPNTTVSPATTPAPANSSRSTGSMDSNAGTVDAVKGARTTGMPAVIAGSTVRNSSVGDFIGSSPNYTTLQNALQSSDQYEMLKGSGPYTLFAPTNSAFKKVPTSVQAGLLDGSHRDALKQLLSYHIVNGSLSSDELGQQIKAGNGKAQLKTLAGGTLTVAMDANGSLTLTDEQGQTAQVEMNGNRQANGMVYGINNVLMPKSAASFR